MLLVHKEAHLIARIGWQRAAVLGANDGILSTASLIVGVASASSDKGAVMVAGLFEYDQKSWVVREPSDWHLCRRLLDAGVRWHAIEDTVATLYVVPPFDKAGFGTGT